MSVVLITGSSSGTGYAKAEKLARNGHIVYATMRNLQNSVGRNLKIFLECLN